MLKDLSFKSIDIKLLVVLASALSIAITYFYAMSMTLFYGAVEILLAIFCYIMIFKDLKAPNRGIIIMFGILMVVSVINGIIYGDIKSTLLLSISLALPIAISVLPIKFHNDGKDFMWAILFGAVLLLIQNFTSVFGFINSNTFGFYSYMAVSLGFVWFKESERKLVPAMLILVGAYFAANTGSRNVAIVILFMLLLLIIPNKAWKNRHIYRAVYIVVLLYTVFAADVIELILSNDRLAAWVNEYTSSVSDKAWGMEGRIYFFETIEFKISQMSWYNKLLGSGILQYHGHNMFYQSIFIYGYLGTVLVYLTYILIFEMAHKLISRCDDKVAIGCYIALIGVFLLNGADLFVIGSETCAVVPQIIMGIVMFKHRAMIKRENSEILAVTE